MITTPSEIMFQLVVSATMFAAGYAACLLVQSRRAAAKKPEVPTEVRQRRVMQIFAVLLLLLGLATLVDGRMTSHDLLALQKCTTEALSARSAAAGESNMAQIRSLQAQLDLISTPPGDPARTRVALDGFAESTQAALDALSETERVRATSPIDCR